MQLDQPSVERYRADSAAAGARAGRSSRTAAASLARSNVVASAAGAGYRVGAGFYRPRRGVHDWTRGADGNRAGSAQESGAGGQHGGLLRPGLPAWV